MVKCLCHFIIHDCNGTVDLGDACSFEKYNAYLVTNILSPTNIHIKSGQIREQCTTHGFQGSRQYTLSDCRTILTLIFTSTVIPKYHTLHHVSIHKNSIIFCPCPTDKMRTKHYMSCCWSVKL